MTGIDLSPQLAPPPPPLPPMYEVLKFVSWAADGSANFQPLAMAPTLAGAYAAIKAQGVKHYSIRVCVYLETQIPLNLNNPADAAEIERRIQQGH